MRHARNPPPQSVQEKPVATDKKPFEEMNTIAKQIKEQTLVVTDDYFKFLKKAICSNPSRGTGVDSVLKSNAEKNIDLVQEFVHKLSEAKDFQGALRAQTEFMQSQFVALGEQTKNLSEACSKSAASVFNYPSKNVA
jgi:phasin family protein